MNEHITAKLNAVCNLPIITTPMKKWDVISEQLQLEIIGKSALKNVMHKIVSYRNSK